MEAYIIKFCKRGKIKINYPATHKTDIFLASFIISEVQIGLKLE